MMNECKYDTALAASAVMPKYTNTGMDTMAAMYVKSHSINTSAITPSTI